MGASVFKNTDNLEFEENQFAVGQERQININPVQSIRYPRSEQYFNSIAETSDIEQMPDSNILSKKRLENHLEFELTITLNKGTDKRQFLNELRTLLGDRGNLVYEESQLISESKSPQSKREQFLQNSVSRSIQESELSRQLHSVINQDQLLYHNKRNSGAKRFSSQVSGNLISELEQFRMNYERGLVPQTSLQSHLNIMESPKFYGNEYAQEEFEVLSPLKLDNTSQSLSPTKVQKPLHRALPSLFSYDQSAI